MRSFSVYRGALLLVVCGLILGVAACAKPYISSSGDEMSETDLRLALHEIACGGERAARYWADRLDEFCHAGYPDVCGVLVYALTRVGRHGGSDYDLALGRMEYRTNTYGAFAYGYMLLTDKNDWRGAMTYLEKACYHDLYLACTHYGSVVVAHSLPGSDNAETGRNYWRMSCRAGEALGCFFLGQDLRERGLDGSEYLQRACRLGYGAACVEQKPAAGR
ncbi:MAG: hypothetical protein P9L99_12895 [Candidatus Lernaella stagnicola]|nr:hypothetical protein [Candidatus Lernaella stagnicola]